MFKFKNGLVLSLNTSVGTTDTSFVINESIAGYDSNAQYVLEFPSNGEICLVTAYNSGTSTITVQRHYDGSTAASHAASATFTFGIAVAAVYSSFQQIGVPGAAADGSTDDRAALQAAVDDTPVGGTLVLDPNKTYFVDTAVFLRKSIRLNLNGATLLKSNNGTTFLNAPLKVETDMGTTHTWTETVSLGSNTLAMGGTIAALLPVGSEVYLELGTNAIDSGQPDWIGFATVIGNSSGNITIDRIVPYDISGTSHNVYLPTQIAEDILIERGYLHEVDLSSVANTASLWLRRCRRICIEDVEMYGPSLLLDCVDGVTANITIRNQLSDERGVDGWHIHNTVIEKLRWVGGFKGLSSRVLSSTEVRTFGLKFISVDADMGPDSSNIVASVQTGSSVSFDKLRLTGSSIYLGTSGGDIIINELDLFGEIVSFDFSKINRLRVNGLLLGQPATWSTSIAKSALESGAVYALPSGVYRTMWIRPHGTLSGFLVYFDCNDGIHGISLADTSSNWTDNGWGYSVHVKASGTGAGGGYVNQINLLTRRLVGEATTGTSIDLIIDYFPDPSEPPMF